MLPLYLVSSITFKGLYAKNLYKTEKGLNNNLDEVEILFCV
jgi:hypothetical protein